MLILRRSTSTPSGLGAAIEEDVDTIYSRSDGRFTHSFYADKKWSYYLYFIEDPECHRAGQSDEIKKGKSNFVLFEGRSIGFLRVAFNNTSPFDSNDQIIFDPFDCKKDCPTILGVTHTGMGSTIENFELSSYGNLWVNIYWRVTKNNISQVYSDSIFINPCLTTEYEVNY